MKRQHLVFQDKFLLSFQFTDEANGYIQKISVFNNSRPQIKVSKN